METNNSLIDMAIQFLKSSQVANSNIDDITKFLQKKGLTMSEINTAIEKSGFNNFKNLPAVQVQSAVVPATQSLLSKASDICNIIIVVGGISYGCHYLFKYYISPALTGRKKKSMEESILEVQQSVLTLVKQVEKTMSNLQQHMGEQEQDMMHELKKVNEDRSKYGSTINELRNEITSLKSLLLNRDILAKKSQNNGNAYTGRSFPATPSIPAWQLTAPEPLNNGLPSKEESPDSKVDKDKVPEMEEKVNSMPDSNDDTGLATDSVVSETLTNEVNGHNSSNEDSENSAQ